MNVLNRETACENQLDVCSPSHPGADCLCLFRMLDQDQQIMNFQSRDLLVWRKEVICGDSSSLTLSGESVVLRSAILPRMLRSLLEVDDLASNEVTGGVGDMDGEV